MGMFRETVAEGAEGALHLGLKRVRVFTDLTLEEKERYKADISATNILLQVQDDRVVVQEVRGRYNVNIKEDHFKVKYAERVYWNLGNWEDQNRVGNMILDSDYFKDKMLLMHAHENGVVLDEEQLLFLVREQVTNFDDDVDDLALNVDHVFEAVNVMHSTLC
ncbi:hypothetical protein Tco_1213702 [Tanacetum coccineum]